MHIRNNIFAIIFTLIAGILIGIIFDFSFSSHPIDQQISKVSKTLRLIDKYYVDTVKIEDFTNRMIEQSLEKLDPHSVYIPASSLTRINEEFQGNFEGIGVEYNVKNDTIRIVNPIPDGPSIRIGILAGDRILKINDSTAIGVKSEDVPTLLRGEKGTKVKLTLLRPSSGKILDFVVIRDKVSLYSLDASFMLTDSIGYIKLNRFSATTYNEFYKALIQLKEKGMNSLILDLRGNPGGYLDQAVKIADEFLDGDKKIVFTKGRDREVEETYSAENKGEFEQGKLIVLIDRGSASASEIVAGAIQDWDRGLIIGNNSFGKGLVQKQYNLDDSGGAVRLTVSRYYTPSGRSIQRDYSNGKEVYYSETGDEVVTMTDTGKIVLNHKQFKTSNGRRVFDGVGIMPDLQMTEDSLSENIYALFRKNTFYEFASNYADRNLENMKSAFPDSKRFAGNFKFSDDDIRSFFGFAEKNGISLTTNLSEKSKKFILNYLKASAARQIWGNEGFYFVLAQSDDGIQNAAETLSNSLKYDGMLNSDERN